MDTIRYALAPNACNNSDPVISADTTGQRAGVVFSGSVERRPVAFSEDGRRPMPSTKNGRKCGGNKRCKSDASRRRRERRRKKESKEEEEEEEEETKWLQSGGAAKVTVVKERN